MHNLLSNTQHCSEEETRSKLFTFPTVVALCKSLIISYPWSVFLFQPKACKPHRMTQVQEMFELVQELWLTKRV